MKKTVTVGWLTLAILSLIFVGCGDSQEYVFTNSPNPGATSRQVTLQFDYSDVLAQIPASVGGYRVELYSSDGDPISQQIVGGRVPETVLPEVTLGAFVLRIVGLDASGNPIGYRDFSVPSGIDPVTLQVDLLLAGAEPQPTYHAPDGIAAQLAFLRHPGNTSVDSSFSVAVVALDAAGYRVMEQRGGVNLTLSGSGALAGPGAANFVEGVANFQGLSVNSPGTGKVLTASVPDLASAQSLPFSVSAATPVEPVVQVDIDPEVTTNREVPVVTSDSNGNFVILWSDDAANAVVGRRLTPEGQPVGGKFLVADQAAFSYDVAPLPNGGFVAVWCADAGNAWVQRFDLNNSPVGTPVSLTPSISTVRVDSAVDGRYVVVYHPGLPVLAQRFQANGAMLGSEITVNPDLLEAADTPDVGCDADGNFTVVWGESAIPRGSVLGRHYSADGTAIGDSFNIADGFGTQKLYRAPRIDMRLDGSYVVAYEYRAGNPQILARTFTRSGPVSNEVVVSTTDSGDNYSPDVAIHESGAFAVAWLRDGTPEQIWFARYAPDATLLGSATRAGSSSSGEDEASARVAFAPNGTVAVVWNTFSGALRAVYYSLFPEGTP